MAVPIISPKKAVPWAVHSCRAVGFNNDFGMVSDWRFEGLQGVVRKQDGSIDQEGERIRQMAYALPTCVPK